MPLALKVENLSKIYQLGEMGTGTLSRDIERWIAKMRGKNDPFLKIGEKNDRTQKGNSNIVWSLRDINFEVQKGEVLGIIGSNGAGKSTLLKILSRITSPTTGKISGNGRVSSLLEIGTGFNPELTGRENVFLNGAILGMRKAEIKRHFDAIVDFSGIERYIDTPVKRYSSGMHVRLAFAVAAYLESDILIVDEVLAVGDAEFQKKCLGKMGDVSKFEGRTILFVSHNMDSIINLCKTVLVLEKGMIKYNGPAMAGVEYYQQNYHAKISNRWIRENNPALPHFKELNLELSGNQPQLVLTVSFKVSSEGSYPPAYVAFGIKGSSGSIIMEAIPSNKAVVKFEGAESSYRCAIQLRGFIPGVYSIYAWMGPNATEHYEWLHDILVFEITKSPVKDRIFPYHPNNGFIVAESKIID